MPMTRQQRRKRQSDLAKRGPQLLRGGLPARHTGDDVVALGLVLRARLGDIRIAHRASRTAAMAADLLDRSLALQPAREAIACRMGCAHCCRKVYVSVTAPEAFLLAGHLRQAQAGPAHRAATRLGGLSDATDFAGKADCLMLENDLCSVYGVRPLACRHLASLSLDACIAVYEETGESIPVPPGQAMIGQGVKLAYMAALRSVGLSDAIFEMRGALRIAAATPDAETRWFAGENVLLGALPDPYRPPDVERLLTAFSNDLRELASD